MEVNDDTKPNEQSFNSDRYRGCIYYLQIEENLRVLYVGYVGEII